MPGYNTCSTSTKLLKQLAKAPVSTGELNWRGYYSEGLFLVVPASLLPGEDPLSQESPRRISTSSLQHY